MLHFELTIIHPSPATCDLIRRRADGVPRLHVLCARYEALGPHDAFITAGNAYGIMTAGIDAAVVARHGEALMEQVQDRIRNDYLGEQPVGSAFVVRTDDPERPFLVHAPTMRTPSPIVGTDKVDVATWAALLAIYRHNVTADAPIRTVCAPLMGAGFGAVPADEAARQMIVAWRHLSSPPYRLDWDTVTARERAISMDGGRIVAR